MRRAAAGLRLAGFLLLTVAAPPAWAQDAAALDPAESSCLGQNIGSACRSATTAAGGTCLAGCCCHFVTDPEGATVCAPCLACSDTSYKDPAYKAGACADGGSLLSADSGAVAPPPPVTDAGTVAGPSPPQQSSGGCATGRGGATSTGALIVLFALGALGALRRRVA